jgi:hypothetical protein
VIKGALKPFDIMGGLFAEGFNFNKRIKALFGVKKYYP